MATKTIKAWIDGVVQNIEVEVIDSGVQEPTIEDRLFAIEQTHSPKFVSNVTLLASAWQGTASPYTQVVAIDGVTPHSKVNLQFDAEQLSVFHEKDAAFVAENENGVITVSCVGQKPIHDYTLQATITEVIVNE